MTFKHKLSKRLAMIRDLAAVLPAATIFACAPGDRTVGPGQPTFLSTISLISLPGTVSDLSVTAMTDTSVTLVFTELDDGTGTPASYDIRYAVGPLSWGSAASVTRGTCATPVAGSAIGVKRTCTIMGLAAGTGYQFRLVSFRGLLDTPSTVFGALSNVASGTTASAKPGTVSDLMVNAVTDTSVTLAFTETDDGTGQPASYDIRYAVGPLSWGSAASVSRGTCRTPAAGSAIGARRTCMLLGLAADTGYQFQLVAFRGLLDTPSTVFGALSNVASGRTAVSPAPVATVTVSPASASVAVGSAQSFTTTLTNTAGDTLTGRTVTWATSSPAVAAVSATGLVTGVAAGSATIMATSEGRSDSGTIAVTAPVTEPGTVSDLAVSGATDTSVTLAFTEVSDGAGLPASYDIRYAVGPLSWGSAASVGRGTCATPVAGNATGVKRTCTLLGLAVATSYQFQVVAFRGLLDTPSTVFGGLSNVASGTTAMRSAPVSTVTISPTSASIAVDATQPVTATLKDALGNTLAGRVVTWVSSASAIATVSASGLVTGVAAGTATITATSEGQSGTAAITVTAPSSTPVASVTVSPAAGSVAVGQMLQLTATPKDANGTPLSGRVVTWTSSNPLLATVNASGLVAGLVLGSVTFTATSEGVPGTATVTVTVALPFALPDLLNNASFETGWDGFVNWSYGTPSPGTGTFSISRSQDVARDGGWSAKSTFGPNGSDANVQFAYPFGDRLDVYARVWFYISGAVPNNHHKWIRFQTAAFNGIQGGLYLASTTGGITWCDAGSSPNSNVDISLGMGIPTFNAWHSIEVEYDRTGWNTARGPRVRFWYDGAVAVGPTPPSSVTAYWGDDAGTPNPAGPWLYIGGPQGSAHPSNTLIFDDTINAGNSATGTIYYDRVAVSTRRLGP